MLFLISMSLHLFTHHCCTFCCVILLRCIISAHPFLPTCLQLISSVGRVPLQLLLRFYMAAGAQASLHTCHGFHDRGLHRHAFFVTIVH